MDTKISPDFWSDDEIAELPLRLKFAFLWLITNSSMTHTGFCIPKLRIFEFETGLEREDLDKLSEALPRAIVKVNGGVWVRNFIRRQLGDGKSLASNNITKSIVSFFNRFHMPELRSLVVEEYPVLSEIIPSPPKPLQTLGKPLASPLGGLSSPPKDKEKEKEKEKEKAEGSAEGGSDHPAGTNGSNSEEGIISDPALFISRLNPLFGKKEKRRPDCEEEQAVAALMPIEPEEMSLVSWFMGLAPSDDIHELKTRPQSRKKLVKNWSEIVDRARLYRRKISGPPKRNPARKPQPEGWWTWYESCFPEASPELKMPANFWELPQSMQQEFYLWKDRQ